MGLSYEAELKKLRIELGEFRSRMAEDLHASLLQRLEHQDMMIDKVMGLAQTLVYKGVPNDGHNEEEG